MSNPSSLSTSTILTLLSVEQQFELFKQLRSKFGCINISEEVYYAFFSKDVSGILINDGVADSAGIEILSYLEDLLYKCKDLPIKFVCLSCERSVYRLNKEGSYPMGSYLSPNKIEDDGMLSPIDKEVYQKVKEINGNDVEFILFKGMSGFESILYDVLHDIQYATLLGWDLFDTIFADHGEKCVRLIAVEEM